MPPSLSGRSPQISETAWIAAGAHVVGDVVVGDQVSVWYAAVLRGDGDSIEVGARSNIQDGTVLHADPDFPVVVGEDVTVGHRVVLHGCRIEDRVLIGMGAIVMNGAVIGSDSMVAAGALVLEGTVVPPGSLVMGSPAKVRRPLSSEEIDGVLVSAGSYRFLAELHGAPAPAD